MSQKQKTLCRVHSFYYEGNECPICRSERTEGLDKKFGRVPTPEELRKWKEEKGDRECTPEDIERLLGKFGKRRNFL